MRSRLITPRWLPLLAGLLIASISVLLWQTLTLQEHQHILQTIDSKATSVAHEIATQVNTRKRSMIRMARRWEVEPSTTMDAREAEASLYLRQESGAVAIQSLDGAGDVRWTARGGGEEFEGDLGSPLAGERRRAIEMAGSGQEAVVAPSFELPGTGPAFMICIPAVGGRAPSGYIIGIFDARSFLRSILDPSLAPGQLVSVFEVGRQIQGDSGRSRVLDKKWQVSKSVPLGVVSWTVNVLPQPEWLASEKTGGAKLSLVLGLLMSVLIAMALLLGQTAERRARELEAVNEELERGIQERRRTEQALRASELRFRSVCQSASEAIISADSSGTIISWNRGAEMIFGHTESEALGRHIQTLTPDRHRENHRRGIERLRSGGPTRIVGRTFELHGLRKNGTEFPLELSLGAWEALGERFFTGIIRDITERKQTEEQIRVLNTDLERLVDERTVELKRSNEQLQQFAYVASHDLQEPLRMVASFTQLLSERCRGRLDADAEEFMGYIVEGATRMHELLNGLLAYSRLETQGKAFAPADLQEVFDRVLENLQVAIIEAGAVVTHDALPMVEADGTQMLQLFQNLIGNAIKFRRDATPEIHVSAEPGRGEWRISVRDNGIGIESRQSTRIFVIFQRLHAREEYPGTGIGLAICKKIVERHGGKIWVESEPGRGSVFHFTLRTASAVQTARTEQARAESESTVNRG